MTTAGRHVIVADEGRPHGRTALATVRALGRAGYAPVVTVGPRPTLAQASRWCAGVLPVPDDVEGWTTAVTEAAARLDALLVMPAGDAAVVALGLPGADLVDKRLVRARALDAGLRVPEEQSYDGREALLAAAATLPFPVVVKPKRRTSLVPFEAMRADGPGDLERVPAGGPVVVQPFLGGGLTAFAGVVADGRLLAAVHQRYQRIWPPGAGVSCAAVTVPADPDLEERLRHVLADHEGIAQVQLVDGHLIDVNPRPYGSLSLAVRAGANLPALWCAAAEGRPPATTVRAREGVRYRWLDADLRAVWRQLRAGETGLAGAAAALAPRWGTAHSIEDWGDPRPALRRYGTGRSS